MVFWSMQNKCGKMKLLMSEMRQLKSQAKAIRAISQSNYGGWAKSNHAKKYFLL